MVTKKCGPCIFLNTRISNCRLLPDFDHMWVNYMAMGAGTREGKSGWLSFTGFIRNRISSEIGGDSTASQFSIDIFLGLCFIEFFFAFVCSECLKNSDVVILRNLAKKLYKQPTSHLNQFRFSSNSLPTLSQPYFHILQNVVNRGH